MELNAMSTSTDLLERINAVADAVADDTVEFTSAAARRLLSKDDADGTKTYHNER
jgi:hypothetical protein